MYPCSPKNAAFTFQIFEASSLADSEWDQFLPENHQLKMANLAIYESSTNIKGIYVKAYSNNELSALFYFQKTTVPVRQLDFSDFNFFKISLLLNCIKNNHCDVDFLCCGNLFKGSSQGYFVANHVNFNELTYNLLEYLSQSQVAFTGILFKEIDRHFTYSHKLLKYQNDYTMNMAIAAEWHSLADYTASLSKKYRKRLEKIRNAFEGVVVKDLSLNAIQQYGLELHDLHNQLLEKQPFVFAQINENYFTNLKAQLGDKFVVQGYFINEALIAFAAYFVGDTELEVNYIGLNYKYNEHYALYFNILFNSLALAINTHKNTMELGRTSYVAKASLGALPVYKHNLVYFKKHSFRWLVKLLFSYINNTQQPSYTQRQPFKEPNSQLAAALHQG